MAGRGGLPARWFYFASKAQNDDHSKAIVSKEGGANESEVARLQRLLCLTLWLFPKKIDL